MNGDDAGRGSGSGRDRDLSARLKRLDVELDRVRETAPVRDPAPGQPAAEPSAMGRAFRMSSEFIAGVLAGGGLGWLSDRLLGTRPWGMIVLLMLGFCAGIYNVMRSSGFLRPSSTREP